MSSNKEYIKLGRCGKGHGIKGAFSFQLESGDQSILKKGMTVLLCPEKGSDLMSPTEFLIEKISFGNKVITFLKGVTSLTEVESLTPFTIKIDREQFPEPDDDEFYLADLPGLKVISDKDGLEIGSVQRYYDNGVQTILAISANPSFEIPLVDAFVKDVDLEEGTITVLVPEYIDSK